MIVFVFLICLAASMIGGICGIGGGVIIKPVLDAMNIMSVSTVSFLSGLTVLAMAAISVIKNRRGHELELKRSLPLGIGAAIGGIVGKWLFEQITTIVLADQIVSAVQAIVLGILVLGTLLYVHFRSKIPSKTLHAKGTCVLIGGVLGLLSSFLGIGGGPMNLAVLYYCFSMDTKKAAVNSILVILLSQITSLLMTVTTGKVPVFDPLVLTAMVIAGTIGGFISSKLHKKLSAKATDVLFSGLLCVILAICFNNAVRNLI